MMNHFSDQEVDELSNVEDRIEKCEALLAKKGKRVPPEGSHSSAGGSSGLPPGKCW